MAKSDKKSKELENVQQFKRDLLSYKNHKATIQFLENKILELDTKLMNIKSPRWDRVATITTKSEGDIRLVLIEEKTNVMKRLEVYKAVLKDIDNKLEVLTKEERDILLLVYTEHVPIRKIADVYYKSASTMYRDINRMITKII